MTDNHKSSKAKNLNNRNHYLHILVNDEEKKIILSRMEEAGIKSTSAYIRKMALNGYLIHLDLSDLREVRRLLSISSNNLNQYARRANENGSIYESDIKNLKAQQDELWEMLRSIMSRLGNLE